MPWAKRFGGPGTSFSSRPSRGVITLVTSWPERAQRRAGDHAGHEAVGERHEEPPHVEHEDHERLDHDAGGDEPGGHLVHRVREADDPTARRRGGRRVAVLIRWTVLRCGEPCGRGPGPRARSRRRFRRRPARARATPAPRSPRPRTRHERRLARGGGLVAGRVRERRPASGASVAWPSSVTARPGPAAAAGAPVEPPPDDRRAAPGGHEGALEVPLAGEVVERAADDLARPGEGVGAGAGVVGARDRGRVARGGSRPASASPG